MNSYESYLEKIIDIREREIGIYREFIENTLGVRIREEVRSEENHSDKDDKYMCYKIITVPESKYYVLLDSQKAF